MNGADVLPVNPDLDAADGGVPSNPVMGTLDCVVYITMRPTPAVAPVWPNAIDLNIHASSDS